MIMSGRQRKMPKTAFGKRLYQIMQERNLTQKQTAELIGVDPQNVQRWVTEYTLPYGDTLAAICKGLNVSADWLLGLTDERN